MRRRLVIFISFVLCGVSEVLLTSRNLDGRNKRPIQLGKEDGFNPRIRYKRLAQVNMQPAPFPRAYVCVLRGTCIGTLNNTYTIDPRADFDECPFGQEPCYGGQSPTSCGVRYVPSSSTPDGPAAFAAYPWQAYIVNETAFTGSGVLIDEYHVLTAAHKVNLNINSPYNVRVYVGVWDPTQMTATQNFTASRIVVHPNFASDTLQNDIAVLRLAAPVVLGLQTNVGSACLPEPDFSYAGRSCVVSGWGQSAFGANDAPSKTQRQVTVPIVDTNTCRMSMSQPHILGNAVDRFLDPLGEFCAGGRSQEDACTQDGGSPLICQSELTGRFFVAGLVTWGKGCGQPGVFGVYVNVAYYRPWIDQTVDTLSVGYY